MCKRRTIATAILATVACGALLGQLAAEGGPAVSGRGSSGKPSAVAKPGGVAGAPAGGHDVIVGDLPSILKYGTIGGITSYSIGTTSCNIGTQPLSWVDQSPLHPVIPQNVYRVAMVDGSQRFEQIGMSWCKHGFCAVQEELCGACTPVGGGCQAALGVGCSDPYDALLNGVQENLGPRYQINSTTGVFPFPPATYGIAGGVLNKRIQIANSDLDPALNPGANFFAEAQYIHPEDAADGNGLNNASWRRLALGTFTGGGYQLAVASFTIRQEPAIRAWVAANPAVTIGTVDVPGDGRFTLAYLVTDLGAGRWHYEFAVHNLNSNRSGGSFSMPIPQGVTITNVGFHDINYHTQTLAGIPASAVVDNVDWTATIGGGALTWSTTPYSAAVDGTANALRWATLYNFRFDATRPPASASATLGLFRPGTPSSVAFSVVGPSAPNCPADVDGSGAVNGLDIASLLGVWTGAATYAPCPPTKPQDINGDCRVNGLDLGILLGTWGACP